MIRVAFFWAVLALAAPQAFAGQWIEGTVTHVRDVDTVELNGVAIRLQGVDGPELDERQGQAAKRWMQRLVLRKPLTCELDGTRAAGRLVGVCYLASGEDIGALAIAAGMARDCPRYSRGRYAQYETDASRSLPIHGYCRR